MFKRTTILLLISALLTLVPLHLPLAADAEGIPVQIILLDCSGSANENDPRRLSNSAVKMAIDLLAPGTVAVLPFSGTNVAPGSAELVSLAGHAAREKQKSRVDALSRAGNTPLADAVTEGVRLLEASGAAAGSSLWLFSDGEAYPQTDAQEARLRQLLPKLQERGWAIHIVAFARSQERFVGFLKELSTATHGQFYHATDMDQVQAFFLDLYSQVTGRSLFRMVDEQLPALGGIERAFPVDASARTLSLVVFRGNSSQIVTLVDQAGNLVSENDARVSAFAGDDHYRLITVADPDPGTWRLTAAGQGQLTAYYLLESELALELEEPTEPRTSPLGQPLTLVASYAAKGTRMVGEASVPVQIQAVVTNPDGTVLSLTLLDNGQPANGDRAAQDGLFSGQIPNPQRGRYQVRLELRTPTAQLSRQETVSVEPFPVLEVADGRFSLLPGDALQLVGELLVDGQPLPLTGWEVRAALRSTDNQAWTPLPAPTVDGHRATWSFSPDSHGGYLLELKLSGNYHGQAFRQHLEVPLEIEFVPIIWQLPVAWESYKAIQRGQTIRVVLTATVCGQPLKGAAIPPVARLYGPGGSNQEVPEPVMQGATATYLLRPQASGSYTLTTVSTSADGLTAQGAAQSFVLQVAIAPRTWRDFLPWVLFSTALLTAVVGTWGTHNWIACPRPRGFLVEQTAGGYGSGLCNLSTSKHRIGPLSRALGHPLLDTAALGLPGLERIGLAVRANGWLSIRCLHRDVMLNEQPLTRSWIALKDGDRLQVGAHTYAFLLAGTVSSELSDQPVLTTPNAIEQQTDVDWATDLDTDWGQSSASTSVGSAPSSQHWADTLDTKGDMS